MKINNSSPKLATSFLRGFFSPTAFFLPSLFTSFFDSVFSRVLASFSASRTALISPLQTRARSCTPLAHTRTIWGTTVSLRARSPVVGFFCFFLRRSCSATGHHVLSAISVCSGATRALTRTSRLAHLRCACLCPSAERSTVVLHALVRSRTRRLRSRRRPRPSER